MCVWLQQHALIKEKLNHMILSPAAFSVFVLAADAHGKSFIQFVCVCVCDPIFVVVSAQALKLVI